MKKKYIKVTAAVLTVTAVLAAMHLLNRPADVFGGNSQYAILEVDGQWTLLTYSSDRYANMCSLGAVENPSAESLPLLIEKLRSGNLTQKEIDMLLAKAGDDRTAECCDMENFCDIVLPVGMELSRVAWSVGYFWHYGSGLLEDGSSVSATCRQCTPEQLDEVLQSEYYHRDGGVAEVLSTEFRNGQLVYRSDGKTELRYTLAAGKNTVYVLERLWQVSGVNLEPAAPWEIVLYVKDPDGCFVVTVNTRNGGMNPVYVRPTVNWLSSFDAVPFIA